MNGIRATMIRLGCVGLAVALLAGAPRLGAGATTLRWKFKPGEVLRYESAQVTESKVKEPNGPEIATTLTLTMDLTWTVKEVDPQGVAAITQTIDRIRTSAKIPNGQFAFDSKESRDATSPAGPLFKMLVGAEFSFKLNPQGELSDIKLGDKLLANLKGDGQPAGAQGQFSEAGLKNMLVQMGVVLAGKEVNPGDTWGRKLDIPSGENGETRSVEQTYTLGQPEAGAKPLETINMATKFAPPVVDPNVPVTIKVQEATGQFRFDNAAGRMESSQVIERVDLGGQFQGKEIAQSNQTTTALTLQRDKTP